MERLTKKWVAKQTSEKLMELLMDIGAEYSKGKTTKTNSQNEKYIKDELSRRIERKA